MKGAPQAAENHGDPTPRKLPTTSDLTLDEHQKATALRHDLTPVMVDSLTRVAAGGHTYATRVDALVRRRLVTEDHSQLSGRGKTVLESLGIRPEKRGA